MANDANSCLPRKLWLELACNQSVTYIYVVQYYITVTYINFLTSFRWLHEERKHHRPHINLLKQHTLIFKHNTNYNYKIFVEQDLRYLYQVLDPDFYYIYT